MIILFIDNSYVDTAVRLNLINQSDNYILIYFNKRVEFKKEEIKNLSKLII